MAEKSDDDFKSIISSALIVAIEIPTLDILYVLRQKYRYCSDTNTDISIGTDTDTGIRAYSDQYEY